MAKDRKYGTVTVELGTLGEDEPVFILRGQDVLAIETLTHYREQADRFGCTDNFRGSVNEAIEYFRSWSGARKIPD